MTLLKRLSLLFYFIKGFIFCSFIIRITFFIWHYADASGNNIYFLKSIFIGLFFDIGVCSFIAIPTILYITLLPNRLVGHWIDKTLVYFFTTLTIIILVFTFFAEITFWDEFKSRFNFIAVNYLIYTYEVIKNIHESYPLPILLSGVLLITTLLLFYLSKVNAFKKTFTHKLKLQQKLITIVTGTLIPIFYIFFITNKHAEWSKNRFHNEISKSGIYSFFAAYFEKQMKYDTFYTTIDNDLAFSNLRKNVKESNASFIHDNAWSINRTIKDTVTSILKPNVVLILMESMSASFMEEFGNKKNITPFLDDLAQKSIFFNNLYATGTRTVRGMEAMTLSIPPTPGESIVRRPNNHNLFTIATVFRQKEYDCNFFYGGDGYFDNMNNYFGGNGFNIYDRSRGSILNDNIITKRHKIKDHEVTFENAWGICDADIYNKMILVADESSNENKPFFNFIMTTSNHKPYTYPSNKIDIISGSGRDGAVKYADYALKEFFDKIKHKPWFKNTIFILVADHCASSAGKNEIDIANYHIPAFIVNLPHQEPQKITKQCSQIDLMPTFFSLLHWNYESTFFGKNVVDPSFSERAFLGTYIKLSLIKKDKVIILSDGKKQTFNLWNKKDNSLTPLPMNIDFLNETISWYQTADYLYSNNLLNE